MNSIDISFIVPVYNAERYIRKCLNSILEQTYKNFEVILINDGSRDNSLSILEQYRNIDCRVKVINQSNGGPSKARNCGLDNSRGKYIAFIDADDYVDNDFLKYMISQNDDFDVSICNYIEINSTGKHKVNIFNFLDEDIQAINIEVINEILSGTGGLVWGKLFKSSIIRENNIRFNENYKMCEDLLFVTEYICKATNVNKINKSLYIHNKCNENSITANYKSEMFFYQLEIQKEIKDMVEHLNKIGDADKVLNRRLKDILMYSIYKETKNKKSILLKLKTIKDFISCEDIRKEKMNFEKGGAIDKMLVQAVYKNNVVIVYLLTMLRSFLLSIYNRLSSLRSDRVNAQSKYNSSNI